MEKKKRIEYVLASQSGDVITRVYNLEMIANRMNVSLKELKAKHNEIMSLYGLQVSKITVYGVEV